ncbi:uncharacterized protein LOC132407102 [Hypanus sabinus]|uniref:uncharacterized protein LOC132407102 n=1 Tax=Hypanus sabinus TaxID=79690 RepID=UPI0028C4858E|nr:uncharacterized protein LOC132407102 [Hypanus sabinus]
MRIPVFQFTLHFYSLDPKLISSPQLVPSSSCSLLTNAIRKKVQEPQDSHHQVQEQLLPCSHQALQPKRITSLTTTLNGGWGPVEVYDLQLLSNCSSSQQFPLSELAQWLSVFNISSLLGLNTSLCNWILDFLTGRPQSVRIGSSISNTITMSTGPPPQGCVLSPLLFTLLTHDCAATHSSNHIIRFADDTTVVGLISNNDESAYREEV